MYYLQIILMSRDLTTLRQLFHLFHKLAFFNIGLNFSFDFLKATNSFIDTYFIKRIVIKLQIASPQYTNSSVVVKAKIQRPRTRPRPGSSRPRPRPRPGPSRPRPRPRTQICVLEDYITENKCISAF